MNSARLLPLPPGWIFVLDDRKRRYLHDRAGLEVRRRNRRWILIHNYHDTGHSFKTAAEAIEYAEDVRAHAG